jgi:hypothetical protein
VNEKRLNGILAQLASLTFRALLLGAFPKLRYLSVHWAGIELERMISQETKIIPCCHT